MMIATLEVLATLVGVVVVFNLLLFYADYRRRVREYHERERERTRKG